MKRIIVMFLCLLLWAALVSTQASAATQFEFTLLKDGSGYELSRYTGTSPVTVIPAEYEGLPVKTIADRAFTEAENLIMFVTDKKQETFYAEEGVLFTDDPVKTLVRFPNAWRQQNAAYRVPDDTKAIAAWAFSGVKTLAYLHIPEGVVSIGDYAFAEADNPDLNLTVHCPSSLKEIGKKLTQNHKSNIAFIGPKNAPILKYAQKNSVPSAYYTESKPPAETTVAFAEPDRTEADDPGLPASPKIVKVNDLTYASYDNFLPERYDISALQDDGPDEIRIPLKDHWEEIARKEEGKTTNGYPPQTGLYGIGYTEEEMILRGYDEEGNVTGVRRVNGDFCFSLPGAYELGCSGGKNGQVTVVPYEPEIVTETGVLTPTPVSFHTGNALCKPFRIFVLKYANALFSIDAPPQADGVVFSLADTRGTPNGGTDHYSIMMLILDDPYILESSEQITVTFHRMDTTFENDEFAFRASPLFENVTEDYGEKLYDILTQLKSIMIGPYYPSDGPVKKITVLLNGWNPAASDSTIFLDGEYAQYSKKHIETYVHEMVHAIDESSEAFQFITPSAWQEGRAVYIAEKVCKAMKIKSGTNYSKKDLRFLTDEDKADFYRYFYDSGDRWTSYPVGYMFVKYLCGRYGEDVLGKIEDNVNHTRFSLASDFRKLFLECIISVTDPDVFRDFVRDTGL